MKRAAVLLLIVLMLLNGSSCGKGRHAAKFEANYRFMVCHQGWRVKLWVNGQPVEFVNGLAVSYDMTPFVINGPNTVRIKADRLQGEGPAFSRACEIRLDRWPINATDPNQVEMLGGIDDDGSAKRDSFETTVEFRADVPIRWGWQDADDINALTDADRDAIWKIVKQYADTLKSRDRKALDSLLSARVPLHPGKAVLQDRVMTAFEEVCKYEDYTVTIVPRDKARFTVGSKVVTVFDDEKEPFRAEADDPELLHAGHALEHEDASGEPVYDLSVERMLFVKMRGKWRVLGIWE